MDHETIGKLKALAFLEDFKARVKLEQIIAAATPEPPQSAIPEPSDPNSDSDKIRENYDEMWSLPLAVNLAEMIFEAIAPVLDEREPPESLTAAAGEPSDEFLRRFGLSRKDWDDHQRNLGRDRAALARKPLTSNQKARLRKNPLRAPACLSPEEKEIILERFRSTLTQIDYDSETIAFDTIGSAMKAAGLHDEVEFSRFVLEPPPDVRVPEEDRVDAKDINRARREARAKMTREEEELAKKLTDENIAYWERELEELQARIDQDNFVDQISKKGTEAALKAAKQQLGILPFNEGTPDEFYFDYETTLEYYRDEVSEKNFKELERKLLKRERARDNLDKVKQRQWRSLNKVFSWGDDTLEFEPRGRRYRFLTANVRGNTWDARYLRESSLYEFPPHGTFREPIEAIVDRFLHKDTSIPARSEARRQLYQFLWEYSHLEDDEIDRALNNKSFLQALRTPEQVKRAKPLGDVDPCTILSKTLTPKDLEEIQKATRDRAEHIFSKYLDELSIKFCGKSSKDLLDDTRMIGYRGFASDIASTAANEAMFRFIENQGPNALKEWRAIFHNTRTWHAAMNGVTVGVKKKFDVDGEAMNGPHDPSASPRNLRNCLCILNGLITDECGDPHLISLTDRFQRTPKKYISKIRGVKDEE